MHFIWIEKNQVANVEEYVILKRCKTCVNRSDLDTKCSACRCLHTHIHAHGYWSVNVAGFDTGSVHD